MSPLSHGRGPPSGPPGPGARDDPPHVMHTINIDFDDSMSSSSTDVYDSDNHSAVADHRVGEKLEDLEMKARAARSRREKLHSEDGIMTVGNGRRKLSLAFLQDMLPESGSNIPMGAFMGNHLERALRLTHAKSSRVTLKFLNKDVEADYQSYFWSTMKRRWSRFIAIGGSIAAAVQIAGLMGSNGDGLSGATIGDWGVLAGSAILPLFVISALPYVLSDATMSRWVHIMSFAFLVVTGPLMTAIRYTNTHIRTDNTFNPSIIAPIYIVGLISSIFFLRLRFLHSVLANLVAAPTWFAVFSYAGKDSAEKESYILNSIVLFFACFVASFVAFDIERSLRHQYLSDSRFLSITKNLQSQLDGLERSLLAAAASRNNGSPAADLSSPLERAMIAIRGLLADSQMSEEHLGVLELVMACLSSPNLLTPDLDVQVKEGNVAIDDEQERWLFNEVATRRASKGSEDAGLEQLAQFESFKFGDNDPFGDDNKAAAVRVHSRRGSGAAFCTPTKVVNPDELASMYDLERTRRLLMRVPEFNFPIFELTRSTNGHPLFALGKFLVHDSGLVRKLNLDSEKFMNFLATIESGYHSNLAFHNSIHAADVLHCINYLIERPGVKAIFNDLELLAIYLAAAIHDFDHPGVNNQYLIATSDQRALLYNDKSVLENHHCASAFEVLARKECAFLSTLDRVEYKSLRENVVEMVLATDLAQHFSLLTMFKKKVLTGDTFDPTGTREDRTLLMQILMKCADVSNPTKIGPEYDEWTTRIHEEWYMQGDMEKALGLPVSAFCNRDGPNASNPASSQSGFINFIVSPLYEALGAWTPIPEPWSGLEFNKERWAAAIQVSGGPSGLSTSGGESQKRKQSILTNQQQVMKLSRSKSITHSPLKLDSFKVGLNRRDSK
ncbi:hypothetical protein HDU83_009630 [Entophlyctis luteolus]|nr:hypothetical protein HDU83_009630 [Entophlyctis luteolus]KAJ3394008.1 hypothetical protein HDU84_000507 [Entophlyctis sp. JEL0112]